MATVAKTKLKKKACLLEEKTFASTPSKVDREAGIIYGVKILGTKSQNRVPAAVAPDGPVGYSYNKTARQQMAELCEGMQVNIDHPEREKVTKARSFRDRFGKLQDVTEKADGVYGNLHYLKSHPLAEQVCEAAERMPDVFGLSPVAHTEIGYNGSGYVVEGVTRVRSVDVVGKPATNSTLFEGHEDDEEEEKGLTFGEILKKKPNVLALLEEMDPGISDMPMGGATATVDPDEAIKAAFRTAVVAAFDDDTLDTAATAKRIKDILKAYDKLMEEPKPVETSTPANDGDGADSESSSEDESEKPTVEQLQEELKIRDMLWNKGVKPTPAKVRSLIVLESEDDRNELIESFAATVKPEKKKPRSGFITTEEDEGAEDTKRRSGKDFAKLVTQHGSGYALQ